MAITQSINLSHPSIPGMAAELAKADPVEVETRARALRLMAEHGTNEIKFECRICDDGSVEWWVWFYFSGMSILKKGDTLAEATAKLLPEIPMAKRRGEIFARTEREMKAIDAAEKADRLTANATNPQVPEEPEPFCEATGPMPERICPECKAHLLSKGPCGCRFHTDGD